MEPKLFKSTRAMIVITIALLFFAIDQLLKWYVVKIGSFDIIENFLDYTFYTNYGSAFGLPVPYWILLPLILVAFVLITWRYLDKIKLRDFWITSAYIVVVVGAFSNILDRVWRGFVVDYIHFSFGSTFNVADVMIVLGILALLWSELRRG